MLLLCTQADPRHYFEAPVTDDEAPDYSVRIQHPMCFADVRRRLEAGQYASLDALASDVRLIASNAMSFNAPDTKFYRAAERLLEVLERALPAVRACGRAHESGHGRRPRPLARAPLPACHPPLPTPAHEDWPGGRTSLTRDGRPRHWVTVADALSPCPFLRRCRLMAYWRTRL